MADDVKHGRQGQHLAEWRALVDQHPNPLVDTAVGGGESVAAEAPRGVTKLAPLLARATIFKRQTKALFRRRLVVKAGANRRQQRFRHGVTQKAVAENVDILARPRRIVGRLR